MFDVISAITPAPHGGRLAGAAQPPVVDLRCPADFLEEGIAGSAKRPIGKPSRGHVEALFKNSAPLPILEENSWQLRNRIILGKRIHHATQQHRSPATT